MVDGACDGVGAVVDDRGQQRAHRLQDANTREEQALLVTRHLLGEHGA